MVIKGEGGYKPVITIRYGFETEKVKAILNQIEVYTPSDFQIKSIDDYNKIIKKP